MKIVSKYWREAICVAEISLFAQLAVWLVDQKAESSFARFVLVTLIFADFFALLCTLRALWRKKWRQKAVKAARRLIIGASRFVIRLLEKWNIGKSKSSGSLSAKSVITFDGVSLDREHKKARKRKWKHMQTDRERVGFLYRYMITERIKGGLRATAHDTPKELCDMGKNTSVEQELFELYISTRYDERTAPEQQRVERIKNGLGVKS
ncbi:MAG: hypothetical protein E7653_07740 [Ruminococcaceae bacterium]|nr:hypothetical protein [Oscillospiraceae bacterium]